MKKFSVKIQITPKKAVNDPRGTQVLNGLKNLGYEQVENVSVGKYIELKDSYKSIYESLIHAGAFLGKGINIKWLHSEKINSLKHFCNIHILFFSRLLQRSGNF